MTNRRVRNDRTLRYTLGGGVVLRGGNLTAIPYAVWKNRGFADMTVWIPGGQKSVLGGGDSSPCGA